MDSCLKQKLFEDFNSNLELLIESTGHNMSCYLKAVCMVELGSGYFIQVPKAVVVE